MAQQNINTGTLPNDKTGDSLRTAMIKIQNNFSELYTTAPISNSVNIGNATSNVSANSTTVFVGNSGTYTLANSSSITTTSGYYSQVLNSGSNNLVIGTTNATSVLVYTNGITSANLRAVIAANGNVGIGNAAPAQLLTVGGTLSANQIIVGNTTVNFTVNSTFIPATANYALTSNTTNFVGATSAANVVSNAQLTANLSSLSSTISSTYQTMAGLLANVAILTANNTSFVGSVSAANVVSNAQLTANLSNYQTTAGLSANVATMTAFNTSFVGSVSAANVVSNAQLSANLSNYQTTAGLAANVATLTSNASNTALTANNANYLGGFAANSFITSTSNLIFTGTSTFNGPLVSNSSAAGAVGTLTDAANISMNLASYNNWSVTLNGARNLDNPTNLTVGQSGVIWVSQNTTGGQTLTYGSYWKFPGNTAPTLSSSGSQIDMLVYTVRSATSITTNIIYNIG